MRSENRSNRVAWLGWLRVVLLLAIVGFMVFAYLRWGDQLTLDRLALHQQQLRSAMADQPMLVLVAGFGIYVLVTGKLVEATAMSLVFGWLFGLGRRHGAGKFCVDDWRNPLFSRSPLSFPEGN